MRRTIMKRRHQASRVVKGSAGTLLVVCGLFVTGCTHTVEVPREDFDMVRDAGAEYLKVRTVSGETWTVYECWATDSTLVVSMTKGPVTSSGHYPSTSSRQIFVKHQPPVEIPFDEICWIDRVEKDEVVSNAALVTAGTVGFLFFLMVMSANNSGYN